MCEGVGGGVISPVYSHILKAPDGIPKDELECLDVGVILLKGF